ncbi:MAG: glycosyl hydrolase family 18 protein [Candidatus Shapirobacteria bacterium]|nr:glycosyl hydrolase family 18 protein [Candidatus Shapirobacteria bacterium]
MVWWKWLGIGVVLLILMGLGVIIWQKKVNLISPWVGEKKFGVFKRDTPEIIGFLPTWMVGKTQNYDGILDQLIFLGVDVGSSGNLIWDVQGKKINDENYLTMKTTIKKNGGKNILGIKLFDTKLIDSLVSSGSARKTLLDETKAISQVADYDGINIDFEYMGDPVRVLSDDFLGFLDEFKKEVGGEISIDVFANTVIKGDSVGLTKLANVVDKVIVMAYDFHQPSSDFAGPVAPINSVPGERNITEVTQKIIEAKLPKNKIVLAYPLYGYQWRTTEAVFESKVVENWSRMVSWNESKQRMADGTYANFTDFVQNWDELSMTPWVSFKNEESTQKLVRVLNKKTKKYGWQSVPVPITRTYQAYFENMDSMGAKLDLAKQSQVGGVGFWALGYEGEDKDLWKLVKEKMN